MKLLVTGAGGFIGRNLIATLQTDGSHEVLCYHHSMGPETLKTLVRDADFVIHLAGVNRPENDDEFIIGNSEFTRSLIAFMEEAGNSSPILYASSTQTVLDNAYGRSKKAAENLLRIHAAKMHSHLYIYRLPNVFGKWCQPDYNSAVATFCYRIAREQPIRVDDEQHILTLAYIDDVVDEFISRISGNMARSLKAPDENGIYGVKIYYQKTVGDIVNLVKKFKSMRMSLGVPDLGDLFISKLYSTFLSYIPENRFSYPLTMHSDARGSFTEFVRTDGQGQFSVNVAHSGVTKGNHWHHSKHEKFLVVSGDGLIRFRRIGDEKVIVYRVSGEKLEVVEIPPGYTHSIQNVGDMDMVTFMWANECFDPKHPDTYPEEV